VYKDEFSPQLNYMLVKNLQVCVFIALNFFWLFQHLSEEKIILGNYENRFVFGNSIYLKNYGYFFEHIIKYTAFLIYQAILVI